MRYLSPKADITFKRVFGEHKDIVISFLNALLPLEEDGEIDTVEYLPTELLPRTAHNKDTIVDVRCRDKRGRQFLVEMQMIWSEKFKQRVLFNASKAYVSQLEQGEDYEKLEPVYSLNLVNDIFETDWGEEYYHHYKVVNILHTDRIIKGLQFVFVELPKFKPNTITDKKMTALWLRFLNEINERTDTVPEELAEEPLIRKAVNIVEEHAYSPAQKAGYDRFWDSVSTEKTYISDALRKGHAEGLREGRAEGLREGHEKGLREGLREGHEKGLAEGMAKANIATASKLKKMGVDITAIADATGLSTQQIEML